MVRLGTAALGLLSPMASGQDGTRFPAAFESVVAQLLDSPDPVLRGEAALALGLTRRPVHYDALRAVAREKDPEARIRGTVALGYLAAPGVEVLLAGYLLDSPHDAPERHAAAFALGLLPDDLPATAIDTYLATRSGGSPRRERDTLVSLVLGLAQEPHASRRAAVAGILADPANKDDGLRFASLRMLASLPHGLEDHDLHGVLRSGSSLVRRAALRRLLASGAEAEPDLRDLLATIARDDADGATRALALRTLIHVRDPRALGQAPRCLQSHSADEVSAGVSAILGLGGGALRGALERRILAEKDVRTRVAMLRAWHGPASDAFLDACFDVAVDPRTDAALAAASAVRLAIAGQSRIGPILLRLYERADDLDELTWICRGLRALEATSERRVPTYPESVEHLRGFPIRLEALLSAGHSDAPELLRRALRDDRFDAAAKADLLHRWRRSVVGRPHGDELAALPVHLARVLE
jgi:hypothetical protein